MGIIERTHGLRRMASIRSPQVDPIQMQMAGYWANLGAMVGYSKKMDGNGWWFYYVLLGKNNLNKHDEDCLLLLLFGKYGHTRCVI